MRQVLRWVPGSSSDTFRSLGSVPLRHPCRRIDSPGNISHRMCLCTEHRLYMLAFSLQLLDRAMCIDQRSPVQSASPSELRSVLGWAPLVSQLAPQRWGWRLDWVSSGSGWALPEPRSEALLESEGRYNPRSQGNAA